MKLRTVLALALYCQSLLVFGSGKEEERFSDAHFALGTICTITLFGERNTDIFDAAFALIDEIEAKMSVSVSSSEVARINAAAGKAPVAVSDDTYYVVEESLKYLDLSEGKFDISVQPLVELWGIGTEYARIPDTSEIDSALKLVRADDIVLDPTESTVYLRQPGMAIDLGGIAKGHAADVVTGFLVDEGYARGIINLGGNIITFGQKPSGDPWIIGIQDPYDSRGTPIGTVNLSAGSVVTSGIYERYFERDGRRYHHILDPDTGYPVDNELVSVSIIGDKGIAADVFSTIVFALGVTKGMAVLETVPGIDGIFITKRLMIYITSGLADVFSISNKAYILKN